jgi:arginine utilization protein RocB
MDDWREIGIRVVGLAAKLVGTRSVVDTDGEGQIAGLLEQYLREHSADLPHVEISRVAVDKPTACTALLARACPAVETKRTLLLCGHLDTVGFEPYGALAKIGTDSRALKEHFAQSDDQALADAGSRSASPRRWT